MKHIGEPANRSDGVLKVTGAARYTAEHAVPGVVYAVLVQSTIASGYIVAVNSAAATSAPGVLLVLSHVNAPRLPEPPSGALAAGAAPPNPALNLLQENRIYYQGQPVALVVADTLERAQEGARRVQLRYAAQTPLTSFTRAKTALRRPPVQPGRQVDTSRGNLAGAMLRASTRLDLRYSTPLEHHHPMEPHATIASWDGDQLTLHDSTQNVTGVRKTVAAAFGVAPEQVRVLCPFLGGGFGGKGAVWSHVILTAMAARQLGRPVKLALERTQMVGPVGGRAMTDQRLRLGAASDGHLHAIAHDSVASSSFLDDFNEPCCNGTRMLYNSDSVRTTQRLAALNLGVSTYMRAPGESPGSFALESAMDELAYALELDPIALRLKNYAEVHPESTRLWSSKALRACYREGAARFGWARRTPAPGSMRSGRMLVGWGMATATYPVVRSPANASATMGADGIAVVRCGTHDLGTGTYTIMSQIAAEALGVPLAQVRFELGDTSMPESPGAGGSQTTASVGPAVYAAAAALRDKLLAIASADPASPMYGAGVDALTLENGRLQRRDGSAAGEKASALLARYAGASVQADSSSAPGDERKQYAMHSFGAVFVEVQVDPDLHTVRVTRVVGRYGIGRLMNRKTGHSQLMGGVVWGIGMALMEQTEIDPRSGRALNANLAGYHVPVNADIGHIDVDVVEEHDLHINPLGAKGIGEIGIVGVAAAVANAVYHATGKRVRDLPVTLEKLI